MSLYNRFLESVLLPAYYLPKGRRYSQHRRFLEQSQWWSAERLRDFQWQELQPLLAAAFEHSPFYKQKYAASGAQLGDIKNWDDFAKLPPVTREEIRQHRREMRSTAYPGKLIEHATGGSSGSPTRFDITIESYDWRCAASVRAYSWSGCRLGERTLYLWGAPVGNPSRKQVWKMGVFRRLRNELMIPTFNQSEEFWEDAYQQALRFRPKYVVGYVSSLEGFCRYLKSKGKHIPGARAALAAAEPVHQATRTLVLDALKAPLFNTYGSREFMSIAGECSLHSGLHINQENIVLETESPPEAGPSLLLVTDLHNLGMPFIRYQIGDMGRMSGRKCDCGRGLALVDSIDGRVLDVLRAADGRVVPGELFPHLLKEIPEIVEFQVWQKALDHIRLSLVLSEDLSERSRDLIDSETRKWMGDSTRLEVVRVDAIDRRASGKSRVTVGLGQEP